MVIDLTNTWRYYDIEEWHSQHIDHVKVELDEMPQMQLLPVAQSPALCSAFLRSTLIRRCRQW